MTWFDSSIVNGSISHRFRNAMFVENRNFCYPHLYFGAPAGAGVASSDFHSRETRMMGPPGNEKD